MSGGVDSSVAAALLQREGYDVVGCFMRLGSPGETFEEGLASDDATCASDARKIGHRGCCSVGDAADARMVAAQLGVPFYVCNFRREFGRIMDYFADEYAAGRTPNPCVRCNDWLKFGKLFEYAQQIDADFIASGHYAQIDRSSDVARLARGVDAAKDQSYVLFGLPRERLARMLLPIGGMEKPRVRALAEEFGLPVFNKPDSQEICFVPDDDYAGFVERRRADLAGTAGAIVDASTGKTVGEHDGHHRFTIGQRRGLQVALGHPVYVVGKDIATNTVLVGERERLAVTSVTAGEVNWTGPAAPDWRPCEAQFRAHGTPARAMCRVVDGLLEVRFEEPQFGVAPGQAVVC
ncbi:MAG: tRNA 2-thiouridine(34) synthase MnmA, partial [Phycisphaerales bacterium]|nr:tRNA 2-thiouridine(34) synthase MnmA [Phycisphaerales bacterium]